MTPATVFELSLTVQGVVEAYSPAVLNTIADRLRPPLACHEPECRVAARIAAGSVLLAVDIIIPYTATSSAATGAGAGDTRLHETIETTALPNLIATPLEELSQTLGVQVCHPGTPRPTTAMLTWHDDVA